MLAKNKQTNSKSKPVAVLISDVHYNIHTLELADRAMRIAISKANELNVRLIVAGDLHDTKANLRGECVNAIINTFKLAKNKSIVIIGNHDKINEKSDDHSLLFLEGFATIVNTPDACKNLYFMPYYSDPKKLIEAIRYEDPGPYAALIMHQGISGSDSGEYIQDPTAIIKENVAGLRIISGHYHKRQTLELPNGGQWDYIGNPYTLNYGEANDPEKGFQILMDDGSLQFVPTGLRKHIVIDCVVTNSSRELKLIAPQYLIIQPEDLVKVRLLGHKMDLQAISKDRISKFLQIDNFRLEYKYEVQTENIKNFDTKLPIKELLDATITSFPSLGDATVTRIKNLWKNLCEF